MVSFTNVCMVPVVYLYLFTDLCFQDIIKSCIKVSIRSAYTNVLINIFYFCILIIPIIMSINVLTL